MKPQTQQAYLNLLKSSEKKSNDQKTNSHEAKSPYFNLISDCVGNAINLINSKMPPESFA